MFRNLSKICVILIGMVLVMVIMACNALEDSETESDSLQNLLEPIGVSEKAPLIFTNLKDSQSLTARHPELGVKSFVWFSGWCIDPESDEVWNKENTDHCLQVNVPQDYDGFLMLDYEYEPLSKLIGIDPSSDENWHHLLNLFIEILTYVKEQRPLARVGYYQLPYGGYSHRYGPGEEGRQAYRAAMLRILPLLDAADVFFPSLYDSTCDRLASDEARAQFALEFSIELSQMLRKQKVLPYTSNRYHASANDCGYKRIPEQDYVGYLKFLWEDVNYQGVGIDGLVTWGAAQYYFRTAFCRTLDEDTGEEVWCSPNFDENGNDTRWDVRRNALFNEIYQETFRRNLDQSWFHPDIDAQGQRTLWSHMRENFPFDIVEFARLHGQRDIEIYTDYMHEEIYQRLQFLFVDP